MISLSDAAAGVLTGSHLYHVRVQSWLGGDLLADNIPVVAGGEEVDRTLRVPERVSLAVPRLDAGTSYAPTADTSPLAATGQRLSVLLGVGLGNGAIEWFERGNFVITDSRADGDMVSVEAAGLLWLIDEARLASPYQPSGTLASTLRGLLEPALTVVVDAGLTDRSAPSGINWDEDRLGAVLELLTAWPADAYVTEAGYLSVVPATDSTTSVLALTDGTGGTVMRWSGQSSREGAYSAVVARGTAGDGGQVQGVAYDTSAGSLRYGGPFNPLPVPYFYASPLLTTVAQCQAAAASRLATLRRSSARRITATMVTHPGLQVGDAVTATSQALGLTDQLCIVETLSLPYVPGEMTCTLRVVG
jgi:hypothetical protein